MVFFGIISILSKTAIGKIKNYNKWVRGLLGMLLIFTIISVFGFFMIATPFVNNVLDATVMIIILIILILSPDKLPKWSYI